MKAVRIALKVLVWVVVVAVAVILTLPLWLGPVGTIMANIVCPEIVKTDFHLGHLSLNPYTARFELGDLKLSNPSGYSEKYAVTVGDVAFDAKTFSLLTDVIHIEEIKVKDFFVSYVSGGSEKINNFKQIQYNIFGGKEKYEAAQSTKEAKAASLQDNPVSVQNQEPGEKKQPKKFIIDRLEISGLMVQLGFMPIRQPLPLVMTDIGKGRGGATAEEIGQQIWNEILKAAGAVGDQLKALGGAAGHATKSVQALGESTKELGSAVQSLGNGLTDGKNVKAVGESAKKALDSLKGLW